MSEPATTQVSRPSLFGRLTEGLGAVGTGWIFFLMILINADVVGRYFFNRPVEGTTEIVSMSIVGIIYLQLGQTLRHERFIRSDVFLGRLLEARPRMGFALQAVHHFIGAVLLALMSYFCVPEAFNAWQQSEYLGTEGVFVFYTWPIDAIAVMGAAVVSIQYFLHMARDLSIALGIIPPPKLARAEMETIA
jgi:TRAP-type mannitol/chloroaromatic compound transport system permease small subunit